MKGTLQIYSSISLLDLYLPKYQILYKRNKEVQKKYRFQSVKKIRTRTWTVSLGHTSHMHLCWKLTTKSDNRLEEKNIEEHFAHLTDWNIVQLLDPFGRRDSALRRRILVIEGVIIAVSVAISVAVSVAVYLGGRRRVSGRGRGVVQG